MATMGHFALVRLTAALRHIEAERRATSSLLRIATEVDESEPVCSIISLVQGDQTNQVSPRNLVCRFHFKRMRGSSSV